ncbi:glycosyltransferase family 4 protein [Thiopseudomonas alkaliphila]|uniref:glycosyltransferase family 4 protein n=1 Tax=Thiopseudomonas alkaliphila TaxID=1697053 RepID=UPI002578D456|nr:glycosyltransferase family 4 protein [Thiopseudomonas alkaliphila]MDM1717157.1 glycosyltransferase family 4 protein [Thiopseudomonas alkaliphila]
MRFLILASLSGSLTGFRKPLIQALIDNGLEVHAAAPELIANSKVVNELSAMGVTCHDAALSRTGMNPIADVKAMFALRRLVKEIKPDYFMGYTIKPVIYGNLAAWLARVPKRFALITGLGYAFQESTDSKRSIVKKIAHGLYKLALSKSHTTFFQNPDDEQLFKKLGISKGNANTVVVNGSGVGLEDYSLTPLPECEHPRFLLIGRLLGDKGIREYAEAAQLVKQQYPNVEFDLVGRIDINPNAIKQEELDKWIADGRLNYFGQLKDVKPRIAACSVYVLPSYREGTPRSVLEAMSMGRAIITTDAPGCRETVVNGVNGYLVPVQNSKALAEAMIKLIENPALIASMAAESRRIAEEKYDVNIVNQQMIKGMGL